MRGPQVHLSSSRSTHTSCGGGSGLRCDWENGERSGHERYETILIILWILFYWL